MMRLPRIVRLSSGYLASVAISAAVGIVSVPVVISVAGASVWSAIAVAQATGSIAATVAAFGWPVIGPASIAAGDVGTRARLFKLSLITRTALLVPLLAIAICVITIQGGQLAPLPVLVVACVTPMLGALTASWFFVGEATPSKLNTLDVLPRSMGSVAGVVLILVTGQVIYFVCAQFVGQAIAIAISWLSVRRRYGAGGRVARGDLLRLLREGTSGFLNSVVTSAYQNLPLIVAAWVAPAHLPVYALADKLFRVASLALAPVTQVAQGYVPANSDDHSLAERIRRSVLTGAALAAVALLSFGLTAPWLGSVLSADEVAIPFAISISLGAALGATLMASIIGRACLVALGETKVLAVAALSAALVGIPAMITGGVFLGVTGIAAGYLAAELTSAAIVARALSRATRELKLSHLGLGTEEPR